MNLMSLKMMHADVMMNCLFVVNVMSVDLVWQHDVVLMIDILLHCSLLLLFCLILVWMSLSCVYLCMTGMVFVLIQWHLMWVKVKYW